MTTLQDVGTRARCSAKTASKVLRHPVTTQVKGVRPETAAAVRQAAAELGFSHDRVARVNRRTGTIGIAIADLQSAHYADLALQVIREATPLGYMCVPQATNAALADESRAAAIFRRVGVQGVILTSSRIGVDFVRELEADGIVVVSIVSNQSNSTEPLPHFKHCPVIIDHFKGAKAATTFLLSRGHTRIAYFEGPNSSSSNIAKREGYLSALSESGGVVSDDYVIRLDPLRCDYQVGYEGCRQLEQWPEAERPTAVLCYNDELAIGTLAGLHKIGISVPDQVSVIGYDDIPPAAFSRPSLTTVKVPREFLAKTAVDVLDKAIKSPAEIPTPEPVVPRLSVRDSVAFICR